MSQEEMDTNAALSIIMEDMDYVARSLTDEIQNLSGKTVLITGANGFLPGYLADAIAYFNQQDILPKPVQLLLLTRSPVAPGSRLSHLVGRPDIKFIVQDVCDPLLISEQLHFIIHAASPASPKWYRADPVGTIDANSMALRQLLQLACNRDTESFLYFSSSEVYGNPEPENIPTMETYIGRVNFLGERACYAESKRFGETLCSAFFEQYSLPVKIVRPFHIYGPGLRIDDGRMVAAMISLGLRNEHIELLSDGQATRTYGYVADVTIGFIKVLLSKFDGEVFNVGADKPEISMIELATTIAKLFGQDEPVKVNTDSNLGYLKGAPDRVCPDLNKIRRMLNYDTHMSLVSGLERTIRWYRSRKYSKGRD